VTAVPLISPSHPPCALPGFIATGIFCSKGANPSGFNGLIYGQGITLAKHLAVCCAIIPLIMIVTYGIMFVTDLVIPMRVSYVVRRASRVCVAWMRARAGATAFALRRPPFTCADPRLPLPVRCPGLSGHVSGRAPGLGPGHA